MHQRTVNSVGVQMTENMIESKFMRVFLVLIGALLIFIGPTYIPYILSNVLGLDYIASIVIGIVLLVVGILMIVYLAKKKVIT